MRLEVSGNEFLKGFPRADLAFRGFFLVFSASQETLRLTPQNKHRVTRFTTVSWLSHTAQRQNELPWSVATN